MYYPQQSPGIAHKLPIHQQAGQVHDQSPWSRAAHHQVLGPPNHSQAPTSPAYPLFTHTNGAMSALQHHPHPHMPGPLQHHHHHHQNSLSHAHYASPPNGNGLQGPMGQTGSPSNVPTQILTPHWQQQLLKCEMIRASRSPHHRARASAMASRTVQKSAIPITNPNAVKPVEGANGASKDADATSVTASPSVTSASETSPTPASANANHPSSTVAPIAEPPPRQTAPKPPKNTWSSLDMGGVNIKNLPPTSGLFSFTFLSNLYLNHNALTTIPPEIAKLRHLELLDLSGNNLVTIPPELGMLTSLKELYLFDNHLTNLPPELGTLHQLQTLGIEGNPLDANLKQIVQKEGTSALISYLRDSTPMPPPPPDRPWKMLISQAEREAIEADPNIECFSVLCYNVLSQRCATERMYGYTPTWALQWDYRKSLITTEITAHDADFICLQEVENAQYEDFFLPTLSDKYEGVYWPRSRYKTMGEADKRFVDGCAIFFKSSKYTLVEKQLIEFNAVAMQRPDFKKTDDMFNRVLGKDHIAVVCLIENKESGSRLVIANTHITWDPQFRDVKLVQVALLIEEIEKIANSFAKYPPRPPPPPSASSPTSPNGNNASSRPPPIYTDGSKVPVIISGDFNSVPVSGVYEFFANGSVPPGHEDFMSHVYGRYTSEGLRHRLGLKSAYAQVGELAVTNYTSSFRGAIDYIWYSAANISVNAVLGGIDKGYLDKVVGFPNAHHPSDHVSIMSEFRMRLPREAQQPRPPPVFPDSSSRVHA